MSTTSFLHDLTQLLGARLHHRPEESEFLFGRGGDSDRQFAETRLQFACRPPYRSARLAAEHGRQIIAAGFAQFGQVDAARQLGISLNRLNEIVLGKRGITADTALRLSRLLKTSPQLWMRLQADWDLHQAMRRERRKAS